MSGDVRARPVRIPALATLAVWAFLTACTSGGDSGPFGSSRSVQLTSAQMERYYTDVQARLLEKGFLRTDGGLFDADLTAEGLAQNFENIAMYDEFVLRRGRFYAGGAPSNLRRWTKPVRIQVTFGDSVPDKRKAQDLEAIDAYVNRLQRLTGHRIEISDRDPNFHVLIMNAPEMRGFAPRLRELSPTIPRTLADYLLNSPLQTFCAAYSDYRTKPYSDYKSAIVIIKAEHPDLMRLSCIHEEMAQALGLTNDRPDARPSIFNDDEEFALLTKHDEMLLKILYDPRLRAGMSRTAARPTVMKIASELISKESGQIKS